MAWDLVVVMNDPGEKLLHGVKIHSEVIPVGFADRLGVGYEKVYVVKGN